MSRASCAWFGGTTVTLLIVAVLVAQGFDDFFASTPAAVVVSDLRAPKHAQLLQSPTQHHQPLQVVALPGNTSGLDDVHYGGFELVHGMEYNAEAHFTILSAQTTANLSTCIEQCRHVAICAAVVVRTPPAGGFACVYKRGPMAARHPLVAFLHWKPPWPPQRREGVATYLHTGRTAQFFKSTTFRQDIAFGLITAPKYLRTRAETALSTWLCNSSAVMLVEEGPQAREDARLLLAALPAACQFEKLVEFMEPTEPNPKHGSWKNFPLAASLFRLFPNRSWYGFVDDDTFVLQHNLNIELTSFYDPSLPVAVGMTCPQPVCHIFHYMPSIKKGKLVMKGGYRERLPGVPITLQGGAGFYLSRPALAGVVQHYAACVARCLMDYGDNRLSCCLRSLHVPMLSTENMWSTTAWWALYEHRRQLVSSFPTSFHMFRNTKHRFASRLHNWTTMMGGLDLATTCAATSQLAGRADLQKVTSISMCAVFHAQRTAQDIGSDAGKRQAVVLGVPLPWDALHEFVKDAGEEVANSYKA